MLDLEDKEDQGYEEIKDDNEDLFFNLKNRFKSEFSWWTIMRKDEYLRVWKLKKVNS